jgi:predicted MFS family arabinose efflux permease
MNRNYPRAAAFFCGWPLIFMATTFFGLLTFSLLSSTVPDIRTRSQHPHRNGNPDTWVLFGRTPGTATAQTGSSQHEGNPG